MNGTMRPVIPLLFVLALAAAFGCSGKDQIAAGENADPDEVNVTVSKADKRAMTLELRTTGDLRAFAEASVISEVAGTIEELFIEKGDRVKEGEVIAVVEHAEASAGVQEAEAALQVARAQVLQAEAKLKNVETEFNRVKKLFDDGVAAEQMLDEMSAARDVAVAAKEMALAQVAQAEAALERARVFLNNHTIRATISGVITARHVDKGDKNNPAEPIVSISEMDRLKVMCDFPEPDLPLLGVGQKAYLEIDAYPGERFPAEVKIISPCMDAMARTVSVELWASNPAGRLRPGMYARVTVIGEKFDALAVLDDALTRIPGTGIQFVYVVDGNIARRVDLKTGRCDEGWTEVTGEILPGDFVVVEGQNNLKSGSRVRIVSTATE